MERTTSLWYENTQTRFDDQTQDIVQTKFVFLNMLISCNPTVGGKRFHEIVSAAQCAMHPRVDPSIIQCGDPRFFSTTKNFENALICWSAASASLDKNAHKARTKRSGSTCGKSSYLAKAFGEGCLMLSWQGWFGYLVGSDWKWIPWWTLGLFLFFLFYFEWYIKLVHYWRISLFCVTRHLHRNACTSKGKCLKDLHVSIWSRFEACSMRIFNNTSALKFNTMVKLI